MSDRAINTAGAVAALMLLAWLVVAWVVRAALWIGAVVLIGAVVAYVALGLGFF